LTDSSQEASRDREILAQHFSTEPETLESWIQGFREVLGSVGREQSQEETARTVHEVLSLCRSSSQVLERLFRYFFYTANPYQEPHRRLQNFSEALNRGLGAVQLYDRLGISMNAAQPRPLGRESIGNGYFLQISPGEGEAAGGLYFTLIREEGHLLFEGGTPLAEIGVLVGLDKAQVVFVQGEKGYYSAHVNQLKEVLGQDPFDWLIQGVSDWARGEGFESLQAYSYTHNYWLRNRIEALGESPESQTYQAHLRRLYDRRFERLGFLSHSEISGLFEKPLQKEGASDSSAREPHVLARMMNHLLRSRETVAASLSTPILEHFSLGIDRAIKYSGTSFPVATLEKGREVLLQALKDPATQNLARDQLFNLEENYPEGWFSDYVFAVGNFALQGKTPIETLEILSTRLSEGSETQSFYRGLGRVELKIWNLGYQVLSRRPNGEKVAEVSRIAEEVRKDPASIDLSKKVDEFLEAFKGENPSALRVSMGTLLKLTDLFREQSMQHVFFSLNPSETANDFAKIGGIMMRMDLPERLVFLMKPMKGKHVAFQKSDQNLRWLIQHFQPSQLYFGKDGLDQALREAEASAGLIPNDRPRWFPPVEIPLYGSRPVINLLETALQHPPARHLLNQIALRKSIDRIFQLIREGKTQLIEGQVQGVGSEPIQAFDFLKDYTKNK
jgi:hypothetical protein